MFLFPLTKKKKMKLRNQCHDLVFDNVEFAHFLFKKSHRSNGTFAPTISFSESEIPESFLDKIKNIIPINSNKRMFLAFFKAAGEECSFCKDKFTLILSSRK